MTHITRLPQARSLSELWPLLAFGVGMAGLIGTLQVVGEVLAILECSGAVGGTCQDA